MPPKSKFALPDIEHEPPRPSRPSAIRTNADDARIRGVERSKAAKAAADARTAKARAQAAEARARGRDTPPIPTTPEPKATTVPAIPSGVQRVITRTPQKALVAELVAVVVLTAVREVSRGESPGIQPFVGAFCVYLVLGFAAELGGEQTARVAAGIGALVLLVVAARTAGPLAKAAGAIRHPAGAGTGGADGVRTMGPHGSGAAGGSHRRPAGTRARGNNLSNPTGG